MRANQAVIRDGYDTPLRDIHESQLFFARILFIPTPRGNVRGRPRVSLSLIVRDDSIARRCRRRCPLRRSSRQMCPRSLPRVSTAKGGTTMTIRRRSVHDARRPLSYVNRNGPRRYTPGRDEREPGARAAGGRAVAGETARLPRVHTHTRIHLLPALRQASLRIPQPRRNGGALGA